MIPEPGDANREITVTETFHLQTDDELSDKELKQIEADNQAIQTILLGLSEDIYAAVDSYETAQEIWLRVQQMMKGSDIGIHEKNAKLFNEWERFTSNEGELIESYYHHFLKLMNDLKRNKHFPKKIATDYTQLYDFLKYNQKENYLQQPMTNPEDITDPITAMNMALALMAKAFKLNYSTPTNNNQRISSNPRNRQIAQPGINIGQDRQMQMVGGNGRNQFRQYAGQNVGNPAGNQIGNGNLVAARAEGNAAGQNGNQIRCYNCRGVGHYARNCTVRPRRMDAAYLQTQLLIAQKEEAGIQFQAEEYDLMADAADLDEIEEVNANCIESVSIRGIQYLGYDVLGFLGVGTTCDIFQNIHLLYLQYGVLVFSGYDVLIMFPSWSLVSAGTDTPQAEQEMETVVKVLQPGPLGIIEHKFSAEEIEKANATVKRAVSSSFTVVMILASNDWEHVLIAYMIYIVS
uniref:Gag-Pol polyprotein n=1 Tax=Tanacetum cinerariifolium TaxID=118510 RepID=A0A6L2MA43_TANCI|nr:Gag-Pol polyprotein [Tanacetum cinerariifolium]